MTQREVVLDGGSPWGFRMHGGIDVNQPLRISRVNPGSKASLKGIREGDLISSINGQSTKEISNSEAHALLKSAGDKLRLNLNEDCQNSPSFKRRHKNIFMHQQQHQTEETVSETSKTTSKTTCTTNTTIISGENGDNIAGNKCKSSRSDNEKSSSSSLTTSPTSTLSSTTATHSCSSDTKGIWSPGQKSNFDPEELKRELSINDNTQETPNDDTNVAPIWSPKSAGSSPTCERKEFRPVPFESPVLIRKSRTKSNEPKQKSDPPWKSHSDTLETRLSTSLSSPGFSNQEFPNSRLPKAQNPTITLLQKAREGQIPKSATYIEQERVRRKHESPYNSQSDLVYELRTESISDSDSERPKKGRKNFEGTEHTTLHGVPTSLRSEVQNEQMSQWYKKMYNTMNKQHPSKYDDDEYVLIRYKQRNRAGRYPFATGYLSEPEAGAYDSDADYNKYATLDRRRNFVQSPQSGSRAFKSRDEEYVRANSQAHENNLNKDITISYKPERQIASSPPYKPKPIEHYRPGESSIAEGEAKRWWDEVMDIFDGMEKQQNQQRPKVMQVHHQLPNYQSKGYLSQALKESGYESDSTLVFRRRDDGSTQQPLSPLEQREVYKNVQKGGDVPLYGLRKPAPEKPREPEGPPQPPPIDGIESSSVITNSVSDTESPRKYLENEVTIHYRSPVRQEVKEVISEDELRRRQADAMRKIYQEERQRKYLQELQDMKSRRHTDNFIASQKSPIPLNRYDDFLDDLSPRVTRPKSPEPRLIAKALYNFVGQSAKELTFKKGDLIYIRRQVDKNWYEGEINAMVGLFPANYVEIVPYDGIRTTPKKAHEGQARAKYNFIAQTHLELSLAKGELVVITRRVDNNWFEGRIGGRKGIFPVSYVEVLVDPTEPIVQPSKPVASPAAHSIHLNGQVKDSMGAHNYVPFPTGGQVVDQGTNYKPKPIASNVVVNGTTTTNGTYGSLKKNPMEQTLHIDIQNDPIPYRAMYKYKPQNEDELELLEGDKVHVLEKCDDGWYVGTSERTGAFGTFPGNYVERI